MIDREIQALVREAIEAARRAGALQAHSPPDVVVQRTARREHGDWTTNVALALQRQAGMPARRVAEVVAAHLPAREWIRKVEVAGPGFINFFLSHAWLHEVVQRVLDSGPRFGSSTEGGGQRVNVEFVSINPTGPLHVGHARNAALGDAIARLLEHTGHRVTREYYFNDAGSQMTNFGLSVAARYLQLLGREAEVPPDGYFGDYVRELARQILAEDGDRHASLPFEELGEVMRRRAYPIVIGWIERALERFGVHMDVWSRESALYEQGKVDEVLRRLEAGGHLYERDGARWLRTTAFGDSRDRPVVRSFGAKEPTYLLPDLAYHLDKVERGFERMIVILGSDHHGHGPSLRAGMAALGVDPERIEIIIYQWVHVLRGGEPQPMSKRSGTFLTLDELIDEVGADAARYTLLRTSADHDLRFDIEEVKRQSLENPVYYVQYAHARIASILRFAAERGVPADGEVPWDELVAEPEVELMGALASFEETVSVAAQRREPYRLCTYAESLAATFHRFYTTCRVVTDDERLTRARLALVRATKQVLSNCLGLLGVGAPERMEREA